MKVNSINSIRNFNTYNSKQNALAFKHTAVPYPEFESAYNPKHSGFKTKISFLVDKISDLFHPEVTKEAQSIKSEIDKIYDENPKAKLVSVLA